MKKEFEKLIDPNLNEQVMTEIYKKENTRLYYPLKKEVLEMIRIYQELEISEKQICEYHENEKERNELEK
jgi:DNA-binding transcriptional MerR regulator